MHTTDKRPRLTCLGPRVKVLDQRAAKPHEVERIRGRRLQAIREHHFALYPLCVHCDQASPRVVRLATELDHTVPLWAGGPDTPSNRQGLCHEHHAIKSAAELLERMGLKTTAPSTHRVFTMRHTSEG